MIERREHLRVAAEAREPNRIVGDGGQQQLDRDVAIELGVASAIHLAHATGAESGENLVGADLRSAREAHSAASGWSAASGLEAVLGDAGLSDNAGKSTDPKFGMVWDGDRSRGVVGPLLHDDVTASLTNN